MTFRSRSPCYPNRIQTYSYAGCPSAFRRPTGQSCSQHRYRPSSRTCRAGKRASNPTGTSSWRSASRQSGALRRGNTRRAYRFHNRNIHRTPFSNRFDAGGKDDCLFKTAAVKRFVSNRFQSIRQRNFCQVMRMHERLFSIFFSVDGKRTDGI